MSTPPIDRTITPFERAMQMPQPTIPIPDDLEELIAQSAERCAQEERRIKQLEDAWQREYRARLFRNVPEYRQAKK